MACRGGSDGGSGAAGNGQNSVYIEVWLKPTANTLHDGLRFAGFRERDEAQVTLVYVKIWVARYASDNRYPAISLYRSPQLALMPAA